MARATRKEYVAALRKTADFLESNADVPVPFDDTLYWYSGDYEYHDNPTEGSDGVKALTAAAPKVTKDGSDSNFWVVYDLGPIKLRYGCSRESVCEKVVVGTRIIPATPETVIPAVPEHEEEIVEWQCKPLLADKVSA